MRDQDGRELGPGGAALHRAATVDVAGLDPRLAATTFVLAGDVDNPLLGPSGAAAVYGPQKGATIADVALLEGGLSRWVDLLSDAYGPRAREVADSAGAGAAGGVGFAALLILGGRFRPGVEVVLELTDFVRHLRGAALVITGEGSLDGQSLHGKAPIGVAAAAGRSGVPTVAVSGMVAVSHKVLSSVGIRQAYGLTDLEPDVDRCMREAAVLVEEVARRVARDWLTGDRCRT
jgi:glycerate kinase